MMKDKNRYVDIIPQNPGQKGFALVREEAFRLHFSTLVQSHEKSPGVDLVEYVTRHESKNTNQRLVNELAAEVSKIWAELWVDCWGGKKGADWFDIWTNRGGTGGQERAEMRKIQYNGTLYQVEARTVTLITGLRRRFGGGCTVLCDAIMRDVNSAWTGGMQTTLLPDQGSVDLRPWVVWLTQDEDGRSLLLVEVARLCLAEIEGRRDRAPAMPKPTFDGILTLTERGEKTVVEADGNQLALFDRHGRRLSTHTLDGPKKDGVPLINRELMRAAIESGGKDLQTKMGYLSFFYLPRQLHYQLENKDLFYNPGRIVIEGGVPEFVRRIGGDPNNWKHINQARRALAVFDTITDIGTARGRLASVEEQKAGRGRKPVLYITPGMLFDCTTVHKAKKGTPERQLVPAFDIAEIPVNCTRDNEQVYVLRASALVLDAMKTASIECVEKGGVDLNMESILIDAGVPGKVHDRVLAGWIQGHGGKKPFLKRLSCGRWALADEHKDIWKMILRDGRKRMKMSAAGKRAVRMGRKGAKRQ